MNTHPNTLALVTGAAHGLGLEIVRQLAQKGITVLLTARDLEKAEQAAQTLRGEGLDVHGKSLDVSSQESVKHLASELEREWGRLDLLVNNAAAFVDWSEKASSADLDQSRALFEVNLYGPWRTLQAFLPLLRKSKHPRVVNVSSGAGSHDDPAFGLTTGSGSVASYGVSKAALNALTSKFAAELEGTGILVNAVCPGFTATAPGMENMGARAVSESAPGVVWAATLEDGGPSGGFFRDGQALPW